MQPVLCKTNSTVNDRISVSLKCIILLYEVYCLQMLAQATELVPKVRHNIKDNTQDALVITIGDLNFAVLA